MNVQRLQLMVTMLREVVAGTWHATVMPPKDSEHLVMDDGEEPENISEVSTHWDLDTWLSTDGSAKTCGFTACAVGHACLDKRFVDQGLKFDEFSEPVVEVPVTGDEPDLLDNFEAAAFFFDIDGADAQWLFAPHEGYQTPEHVIARIESFIAGYRWEQTE